MSFQSELDELIEETAKAATDAFVHWTMEGLWDNTWAPNWVREGNYDDGWICGDWLDGQHVTFRSPSTGKVPSPFWATDVPFVALGDHLRKDLENKPEEWHQTYVDQLNTTFAKWRSLPEESVIVAATERILDHAAWQINWQPGLGLQVKPSLDGWLADVEPVNTENYGQAFDAFYSRYGETRDILCNNLRQDLIDLAACGAADAAAINAAKASALSLAAVGVRPGDTVVLAERLNPDFAFPRLVTIVNRGGATLPELRNLAVMPGLASNIGRHARAALDAA